MGRIEDIRDLVTPALISEGFDLWDVEVSHSVVRVLVDRPGGVDLDALTAASRIVSPLLDEHADLTPAERFQLEVSSPGAERNLRTVEQYQRYIGEPVTIKTAVAVGGARRHHGTLLGADGRTVRIRPDDAAPEAVTDIALDQIERTRTVLVWGPTPNPKSRPTRPRTSGRSGAEPGSNTPAAAATKSKEAGS